MSLIPNHDKNKCGRATMLSLAIPLIITLMLAASVQSANYIQSLGNEIQIPSPEGWQLGSDTIAYPFQFVSVDPLAEFLIFKSIIEQGDMIRNEDDLHQSVDVVIEDVLLGLPDARVTTSSGFYDGFRTGFVIEFLSTDSSSGDTLQHRFCGHIYRHPDGHQILFTLWAKSLKDDFELVQADIKLMQDGFRYEGPLEEEVFTNDSIPYTRLAILLVMMTVLFYLLRRRRMKSMTSRRYSDNRYWRCQCGRVNRTTVATCCQCGRMSPELPESAPPDLNMLDNNGTDIGGRSDDQS